MQVTVWHQVRVNVPASSRAEAIEQAYEIIELTSPGVTLSLGYSMVGDDETPPALRLVE